MSDTPASLVMVGATLRELADPAQADITLAYYLEPVLWPLSAPEISETLRHIAAHEHALPDSATTVPPPSHFEKARALIVQHGLSGERVHMERQWQQPDLLRQRKRQLAEGKFSAVILVRHHYDMLFGLLGITLRKLLNQFGHQVHVHIYELDHET